MKRLRRTRRCTGEGLAAVFKQNIDTFGTLIADVRRQWSSFPFYTEKLIRLQVTHFTHEFRSRSLVGVAVLVVSAIAIPAVAMSGLPSGFQGIACFLLAFIAICSTLGLVTNHRVGSSLDGKHFRWWSKRGILPFARSVPLDEIRSVDFVNGRGRSDRTFLRLELKNGRRINVATFFFLDGEKLLEAFRVASPRIAVAIGYARNG